MSWAANPRIQHRPHQHKGMYLLKPIAVVGREEEDKTGTLAGHQLRDVGYLYRKPCFTRVKVGLGGICVWAIPPSRTPTLHSLLLQHNFPLLFDSLLCLWATTVAATRRSFLSPSKSHTRSLPHTMLQFRPLHWLAVALASTGVLAQSRPEDFQSVQVCARARLTQSNI